MKDLVVFTDLDGTLLDHDTYAWAPAENALVRLRQAGVPLVMVSSKNRFEIEAWRSEIGNSDPFVPENGGAVFIPKGYDLDRPVEAVAIGPYHVVLLGRTRPEIDAAFNRLSELFPVRGISRMSLPEISALTGLTEDKAAVAKAREFGEAFVVDPPGADEEQLEAAVRSWGLRLTRGARFYHLLGENDKGRAVSILLDLFRRRTPHLISAALGDSFNDVPMLSVVDRPFLVARPDGSHSDIRLPGLRRTTLAGPAGFNQAILELLDEWA